MGRALRAAKFVARSFMCCKKKPPQTFSPTEEKVSLVGINAYPTAPLNGCVNDIENEAEWLCREHGVLEKNIRLLTDGRATTSYIREHCEWLAAIKEGGRAFFGYSGHGARVPARNGDGEVDDLLEVICPVDFDWSPSRMITDKDFVEIFKKIPPNVRFNWFSDSCHSGDLDRFMPGAPDGGNPVKILGVRLFPIPRDMAWRQRVAKARALSSRGMVGGKLDVGFMSGCRSDQTSADASFGGKAEGAFTHMFLEAWKKLDNPADLPLREICKTVNNLLLSSGFRQEPTCSGARADKPFLK